ncbi:hypothetical protein ACFQ1M_06420 [Sungkyunkwania multivorans]|uniref:Uncharacterized protein n=1 Tax=Sungkyunkwania multivorans TaxID=1173618 RepID=A0ABW3CX01_9FLAO
MNEERVVELLLYLLPAIVTGLIALYFFRGHTKNEEGRRRFLIHKEAQKNALPLRLQAYERMALFLERIAPAKLLLRVSPPNSDKEEYEQLLVRHIENEFDHNLAQQIYISDECWNIINAAKNATIQLIRKSNRNEEVDSADKLRETILSDLLERPAPSSAALSYIKQEVGELW